jgi:hypothetical protein
MAGGDYMATSTFYDTIWIDDKAADILIKGLKGPKHPYPDFTEAEETLKRSEEAMKWFHANSERFRPKKTD